MLRSLVLGSDRILAWSRAYETLLRRESPPATTRHRIVVVGSKAPCIVEPCVKDLTAFVLAGGHSSRMGAEKASLEWQGGTLLDRALHTARSVSANTRVVGPPKKFARYGEVVEDVYHGCGPLGGIHAALASSTTVLNLVLAVDMPLVERSFLEYLVSQAREGSPVVTLPRAGGGWQPLCAIYRRSFVEIAASALREGRNKIDALFPPLPIRVIEEHELRRLGFDPAMFDNLNTRAELEQARVRVRHEGARMNGNKPYIEFQNVSKAFGSNRVLDGVSFDVLPGETVCILGRSGVGKSVALHHIMGFLKPDAGRVIVAYEDITDYRRKRAGAHPQEGHDGFPERGALRFAHGRRERGFSAARAPRPG